MTLNYFYYQLAQIDESIYDISFDLDEEIKIAISLEQNSEHK